MTTATLNENNFDIAHHKRTLTDEINKYLNNGRAVLLIPQDNGQIRMWGVRKDTAEKFVDLIG